MLCWVTLNQQIYTLNNEEIVYRLHVIFTLFMYPACWTAIYPHDVARDHNYECNDTWKTPPCTWYKDVIDCHFIETLGLYGDKKGWSSTVVGRIYISKLETDDYRDSDFTVQQCWKRNMPGFMLLRCCACVTVLPRSCRTLFPRRWTKEPWWETSQKILIWIYKNYIAEIYTLCRVTERRFLTWIFAQVTWLLTRG